MKVAIIGGSGFIGTHLAKTLGDDVDFTIFDIKESATFARKTVHCDVRDAELLKQELADFDSVILLAAEHKDNIRPVSLYYDVNVQGLQNVLDAMDHNNINNIVFTSSVAIYGMNRASPPNEKTKPAPFNDYGQSKLDAEHLLNKWTTADASKNALIVRPTVVFGENNRGNVYNLLRQIHSGKFLMVGNGKNEKSMAYVENLVAFMNYMLAKGWQGTEVFNYIDKPDLNMNVLADTVFRHLSKRRLPVHVPYGLGIVLGTTLDQVGRILGKEFPLSAIRVKKFCSTTVFDATKVFAGGFQAPFSLIQGLEKTLRADFSND